MLHCSKCMEGACGGEYGAFITCRITVCSLINFFCHGWCILYLSLIITIAILISLLAFKETKWREAFINLFKMFFFSFFPSMYIYQGSWKRNLHQLVQGFFFLLPSLFCLGELMSWKDIFKYFFLVLENKVY